MRKLGALVLMAALPHVAGAQDTGEDDDPVARLHERIEALEFALYPRGVDPALVTEDMSQMRNLAGLLVLSNFPMRDGALDVYRVADDVAEERQLDLLRSARTGIGPSREELAEGDYTHFPYERFRGDAPPPGAEPVPVLWDRAAQPDGTRLVALSNGAVKRMKEAEVRALLEKCGQTNLKHAKEGVSFTCPRRFRVLEIERGQTPVVVVDDPATRSVDILVVLHGKQTPQFLSEFYRGFKVGIKVEKELEQTPIREKIGDAEVTGTKLVYQGRNDPTRHVLRFFALLASCTIAVQTTEAADAFVYPRLRAVLSSVAVAKAGSK